MNNIISQEAKDKIDALCKQYNIKNYVINNDATIDVDGDVNLYRTSIKDLPIRFNKVSGTFDCSNNFLTSLEGSPIVVGDNFWCSNNLITSLEHCPMTVGGIFSCNGNKLTTLRYISNTTCMSFICKLNKLSTLEFCPKEVTKDFNCENNLITSLIGCPSILSGYFRCDENQLTSLAHSPREFGTYFSCEFNNLPYDFISSYNELGKDEQKLIFKYMNYYDVWIPEFNKENLSDLIADIKEGLK